MKKQVALLITGLMVVSLTAFAQSITIQNNTESSFQFGTDITLYVVNSLGEVDHSNPLSGYVVKPGHGVKVNTKYLPDIDNGKSLIAKYDSTYAYLDLGFSGVAYKSIDVFKIKNDNCGNRTTYPFYQLVNNQQNNLKEIDFTYGSSFDQNLMTNSFIS